MSPHFSASDPKSGILLIDTSIVGVSVGVMSVSHKGSSHGPPLKPVLESSASHAENAGSVATISHLVKHCLNAAKITPDQVQALVVSTGPGSFTGIKIGLGFASGWAAGTPHPLSWLGVSALQCAARAASRKGQGVPCTLFLPATRTHGFVASSVVHALPEPRLVDVSTWHSAPKQAISSVIPPETAGQMVVVGAWPLLEKALAEAGIPYVTQTGQNVAQDALGGMAHEAAQGWPSGFSSNVPSPRYLRLSTAEEQLALRVAEQGRSLEAP